jgi:hypothetical protein
MQFYVFCVVVGSKCADVDADGYTQAADKEKSKKKTVLLVLIELSTLKRK